MARIEEKFQVIYKWATFEFRRQEGGGYLVDAPAISNCQSSGATFEEALANAFGALMVRLREDYAAGMSIAEELLPLVDTFVEPGQAQFNEEEPET